MPMVWYVPPLSPIVDLLKEQGHDAENSNNLFGAIESLRIPVEYLAELFTAGDTEVVTNVLRRLAAMRSYMRDINLGGEGNEEIAQAVGMTGQQVYEMYRLMAIAKYNERYVIPKAHMEDAHNLEEMGCSLSVDGGPGMYGDAFNDMEGRPTPVSTGVYEANNKVSLFSWMVLPVLTASSRIPPERSNKWLDSFQAHGQGRFRGYCLGAGSAGEPV